MTRWLVLVGLILLYPRVGQCDCSTPTVTPLTFGSYTGAAVAMTQSITLTCTVATYQLGIGPNSGGTETARRMTNGANTLNFGLFQDASHTIRWGNVAGVDTMNYRGTGTSGTVIIYGLIPAGQTPSPGAYTDQSIVYTVGWPYALSTVSATASFCTISASPLNFGTYSGAQLDVDSTLTVNCTNTTPYYVNLSDGLHVGANYQTQASSAAGVKLVYTLYLDPARTIRWGNTYNLDGVRGTGSGGIQTLTVYGRVFAGQYITPGAYSDTIIATVTY